MQYMSNENIIDGLHFIVEQIEFVQSSMDGICCANDFLLSPHGMLVFNSTCMCLQTIGETIRSIDQKTDGNLFERYPNTPWRQIKGLRNIISHEYLSIDENLIYDVAVNELQGLKEEVTQIIKDLSASNIL